MNYFRKYRNQLSYTSNLIFKYIEISTVSGILIAIIAYSNWNNIYKNIFSGILAFAIIIRIFVDVDLFFIEKLEKNKKSLILQIIITLFISSMLYYFISSLSDIVINFELNLFTLI
jgi:hypothetical protein